MSIEMVANSRPTWRPMYYNSQRIAATGGSGHHIAQTGLSIRNTNESSRHHTRSTISGLFRNLAKTQTKRPTDLGKTLPCNLKDNLKSSSSQQRDIMPSKQHHIMQSKPVPTSFTAKTPWPRFGDRTYPTFRT